MLVLTFAVLFNGGALLFSVVLRRTKPKVKLLKSHAFFIKQHITDFNLVTKSKDAVNHYSSEQSQVADLSLTN